MILVTGGTGFIGSHLVETLRARGEPVRCLVRRNRLLHGEFHGDLISGVGLDQALQGADTVIHLAGVTKALTSREYYAGNVRATENVARVTAGRGIRLVHVSSLAAIGPSPNGAPVSEDAEPHPLTHYGESKLEGERIVRALVPDAVILRPPVVYGPRDTDVFEILRSVSRGFLLKIGAEESYFSLIYVKDLAEGLLAAASMESSRTTWPRIVQYRTGRASDGAVARRTGSKNNNGNFRSRTGGSELV